jgi:Zn finger protein HypA/HybF involved in hydrogenase expression
MHILVMVLLFSKLSTMSFSCIVCEQNVRPKQHALECDSCKGRPAEKRLSSWYGLKTIRPYENPALNKCGLSWLSTMSFSCIVCEQNVRPKQHALECDSCFQWQHRLCNSRREHLRNFACWQLGISTWIVFLIINFNGNGFRHYYQKLL